MTPEAVGATPFDPAIDEVRSKMSGLQTTLDTLLRLQAEFRGAGAGPAVRQHGEPEAISHDTFFSMTIGDAAKKYLAMVKATKSTADISEALESGGLKHSSKSFATTVRSILGQRDNFVRVPNGDWGLAEWYPGMGRGRKPKAEKPTARRKKTSEAPGTPKKRQANQRPVPPKKHVTDQGSLKGRILKFLGINPARAFSTSEIAEQVNGSGPSVAAALSVLLKTESIVRPETGRYQSKEG
jgi:hypothetical protein